MIDEFMPQLDASQQRLVSLQDLRTKLDGLSEPDLSAWGSFSERIRSGIEFYLQKLSPNKLDPNESIFVRMMDISMKSEREDIADVQLRYWAASINDESGEVIDRDNKWHEQFQADIARAREGFLQTGQGSAASARAKVRDQKIKTTKEYLDSKAAHAALEQDRRRAEIEADRSVTPTAEGYDLNRIDDLARNRLKSEIRPRTNEAVIDALRKLPDPAEADQDQTMLRVALRHMIQKGNLSHYSEKLPLIDTEALVKNFQRTFINFGIKQYTLFPDGTIKSGTHKDGQVFDLAASKYVVTKPSDYTFMPSTTELQVDLLRTDVETIVAEVQAKTIQDVEQFASPEYLDGIKAEIRAKIEANIDSREKARQNAYKTNETIEAQLRMAQSNLDQVEIPISDEEIFEQQEIAFRRHLPMVITYALTYPDAVGPQMLVFPNPQPPYLETTKRGFGGTVTTGATTGNIYLHFNGSHDHVFSGAPQWVDAWLSKLTSTEQQSPADSFTITEQSPTGTEQYTILDYALEDNKTGIKIICQSGDESFIPYGEKFDFNSIVRKPAIYLYPPSTQEVIVEVNFQGTFTQINPAFNYQTSWKVIAHPDGQLLIDRRQLRYLFWEGYYPKITELNHLQGFCVPGHSFAGKLEQYLKGRSLTDAEIQDFVTYWVSGLSHYPFVSMFVADELIEKIAPLDFQPQPDVLIRVFCLFKGSLTPIKLQEPKENKKSRKGFVAVEWGGVDLTEK